MYIVICTYTCIYLCVCIHERICSCVCMRLHFWMYMYLITCMYLFIYSCDVFICVYVFIYLCVCIHVCIFFFFSFFNVYLLNRFIYHYPFMFVGLDLKEHQLVVQYSGKEYKGENILHIVIVSAWDDKTYESDKDFWIKIVRDLTTRAPSLKVVFLFSSSNT